jgi:hypothetical protein
MSTALLLFGFVSTLFSQDYAMVKNPSTAINTYHNNNFDTESSVLKSNTYTYEYKGKEVIVIFNNDEHIEYDNNKKYFIKSQLTWKNKYECLLTIIESTFLDVPFSTETELVLKVIETKGDFVYYESTLAGRTWEGKMKISNYNIHF